MITHRKRRKKNKKLFMVMAVLLFVLMIIGIILSPIFKVREINVYGNQAISSDDIKNNINRKNIFLLKEKAIKENLLKDFPKISELKIEKNIIKRTINISLTEREKLGIICKEEKIMDGEKPIPKTTISQKCFYLDKNGFIFEEAPQTSGSLILLVKDYSPEEFALGKNIFDEKTINSISALREEIPLQIKTNVLWFEVFTYPAKEIKAITAENWYIFLDLTRDTKSQLSILKAAFEEKIKNRKALEYVDLRIENRIYYK